eukprot:scaffold275_cov167-Ochromonas_danica.AAC.10
MTEPERSTTSSNRKKILPTEIQGSYDKLKVKISQELDFIESHFFDQNKAMESSIRGQLKSAQALSNPIKQELLPQASRSITTCKEKLTTIQNMEQHLASNTKKLKQWERNVQFQDIAQRQLEVLRRQALESEAQRSIIS